MDTTTRNESAERMQCESEHLRNELELLTDNIDNDLL